MNDIKNCVMKIAYGGGGSKVLENCVRTLWMDSNTNLRKFFLQTYRKNGDA